jgi:6-pyruvoyltetrahydropterin/6-carboxytetrahydropterin synthase
VWDFGSAKRSKTLIDGKTPKEWMDYMFDHTMIIAEDDPYRQAFEQMGSAEVAQVRILPAVGAEKFAEYVYEKLNGWVVEESKGRVKIAQVEFREHEKNNASFRP